MAFRTLLADPIPEKSTRIIEVIIKDETGTNITPDSLTLTYYNLATGAVINSRNAQNVLNQNNVTVTAGLISWALQDLDSVIVETAVKKGFLERHIALFRYTWATGAKKNSVEIAFDIIQVEKIT